MNPIIPSQHCSTDSFSLCQEIQEVSAFNKFMIHNVWNLFAKIPLKKKIKLVGNLIIEKRPEIRITRKQLTILFEFATSGAHFLFNGNYYDPIGNTAVGSPLGPVLAKLFMGYYEKIWSKEFKTCEVVLYRRYVDDIICLFACEKDTDQLFAFLNSRHSNIKFTFEKEKHNKIAFLDICINKANHSFCTKTVTDSP